MPETGRVSNAWSGMLGRRACGEKPTFWFPARRQGCSASATRCFNGVERCCVGPCETAWVSLPCLSFAAVGIARVGVSAQKVEVFKKGSRADFLHYTASIVMVDHGSTRNTPRR
jgi:hypothetical protein